MTFSGSGNYLKSIRYDGTAFPTAVVPELPSPEKSVDIILGTPETPFLSSTDSMVHSCHFDRRRDSLELSLRAFAGHFSTSKIISAKRLTINGKICHGGWHVEENQGVYETTVSFTQELGDDNLTVLFE